jgi:hypothetical protein
VRRPHDWGLDDYDYFKEHKHDATGDDDDVYELGADQLGYGQLEELHHILSARDLFSPVNFELTASQTTFNLETPVRVSTPSTPLRTPTSFAGTLKSRRRARVRVFP